MSFDFDWAEFERELNPPKDNSLEFSKVAHAFRKVAFDAYEKIGETGLWELREREDGTKVLVALYDTEGLEKQAFFGVWTAGATKSGDSVTLQFRGTPVAKFAGKEYGFSSAEAGQFSSFIATKANTNSEFVNKLANTLSPNQRSFLLDLISKGE